MGTELGPLAFAAVSIAFVHTICGPDHYVPFVALARAGDWSLRRTMWITTFCGLGHIASSALLGLGAAAIGFSVLHLDHLVSFEEWRGDLAAWLLLAFGLTYAMWGLRRAWSHAHGPAEITPTTTWALFVVFVFGPCEPLIPLLIYPAARGSVGNALLITLLFGVTTLVTMQAIVFLAVRGLLRWRGHLSHRYVHVFAGFTLAICGLAILAGL